MNKRDLINVFGNTPATSPTKNQLGQPVLPMWVRMFYDGSASIRDNRPSLVEPMLGAAAEFEGLFAQNPENRLSRAIFHESILELDQGILTTPDDWLRRPMGNFYQANGSKTILDEVYYDEIKTLCQRHDEAEVEAIHMLLVFTDGRNNGRERAAKIRTRMQRVLELARRTGGVTRSRIVVAYIGIGLTEGTHLDICTTRYGIPREWFKWFPAGEVEVQQMGSKLSESMSDMSQTGDTVFWDLESSSSDSH